MIVSTEDAPNERLAISSVWRCCKEESQTEGAQTSTYKHARGRHQAMQPALNLSASSHRANLSSWNSWDVPSNIHRLAAQVADARAWMAE